MNSRDQQQLLSFAERINLNPRVADAASPTVSEALRKLLGNESLEDSDAAAIEAIVLQAARPILRVEGGTLEALDTSKWGIRASQKKIRRNLKRVVTSVGRINVSNVLGLQFAGTGFVVGDGIVMTTRRVAEFFTTGVGRSGVAIQKERSPQLDLRSEMGANGSLQAPVIDVLLIHPFLDLALLRVHLPLDQSPPLKLSPINMEDLSGRPVVVIGHVSYDPTRDLSLLTSVFSGWLGYKHVSPGYITGSEIMESYGQKMWALTHDCSILAGSSGGPVVDLQTGLVVGLHAMGTRFGPNFAIPISEIARDSRVTPGLCFDRKVQASHSAWKEYWELADPIDETKEAIELLANRPTTAHTPHTPRDVFRTLIDNGFGTVDKFTEFLNEHGYESIVDAVPRRSNTSDDEYIEALLTALERRDRLNDTLLEDISRTTGMPTLPTDEQRADFRLATGHETVIRDSPHAVGVQEGPDRETAEIIPDDVLNDLISRLRSASPEEPAHSPLQWHMVQIGNPWRDWFIREEGDVNTVTEAVVRLARDANPEARQALRWLVGKLFHVEEWAPETLRLLARSYEHLASSSEQPRPEAFRAFPTHAEITDLTYLARGIEASHSVVLVQVTEEVVREVGGTFSAATGWLLTPSLVVVPAHLFLNLGPDMGNPKHDKDQVAAFSRAKLYQVRFDFDDSASEPKIESVINIELFDPKLDLAVLRLKEPVLDRVPLRVNPDPPGMKSPFVTTIHHPSLGAKKFSLLGGRLLEFDGHEVTYLMSTTHGSAGAPIFDIDWRVVATHRAFQMYRTSVDSPAIRAKTGTSTSAFLTALREVSGTSGKLWREVVAAQPALKVVDQALYARLSELEMQDSRATVPMVIEVLGPSVSLEEVPGLSVSTKGDNIVTAIGTRESVDTLAAKPEVLSVRASPQAGVVECVRSIPHIGASRIHNTLNERGDAALIAIIDNGADIFHQSLRDEMGRTRIVAFWDQKDRGSPATSGENQGAQSRSDAGRELVEEFGLKYGALYVAEDLQTFLDGTPVPATFPRAERMIHGTFVSSIAAGRCTGESEDHFPGGVASAASLIVVRYDLQGASVGYAMGLIDALQFIDKLATRLNKPVVVNISSGMNAGAHDGTSSVEEMCQKFNGNGQNPGRIIVKSAGNERGKARHAMLKVAHGSVRELRWRSMASPSGGRGASDTVELWFHYVNQYVFRIKAPSGDWSPPISPQHKELDEFFDNGNRAYCKLKPWNPENGDSSLQIKIAPGQLPEVAGGEWLLEILGLDVKNNHPIHAWIEDTPNREVVFLDHFQDEYTITIPGTAQHVITVGAIEISEDYMRPYTLSSAGPDRKGREKPEVVAPGVGIRAAAGGSGDRVDPSMTGQSGTSMAAPHVTGAIALALSARAKQADQPQFNSNEIRTALLSSLRHFSAIWNETTGFGELDAAEFFTRLMSD